ncbi:hypothetical protein D3C80_283980 [compost metagenome]
MRDRNAQLVIGLHEREGRARHFQIGVIGHRTDQRPSKSRFTGAEIARKRHAIARLQRQCQILAELYRVPLSGKDQRQRLAFTHSAATEWNEALVGMRQVTVVPSPARLSIETSPLCK